MYSITLILMLWIEYALAIPPSNLTFNSESQGDIESLKYTTKSLTAQLEKWNNLFLTSLEPRISASATSLASIDSNVKNLQKRAHVWDTFQLNVVVWSKQLSTLDRKVDIISKGQEKMLSLESKINAIANIGDKIDNLIAKIDHIEESLSDVKEKINSKCHQQKTHDVFFVEFAARRILRTVKIVEKKLDRLLRSQKNLMISKQGEERPKLLLKCNTRVNGSEENEEKLDVEEYVDGVTEISPSDIKTASISNKTINNSFIQELSESVSKIKNLSQIILNKENDILTKIDKFDVNSTLVLNKIEERGENFNKNFNKIIDSYFHEQKTNFESLLVTHLKNYKSSNDQKMPALPHEEIYFEPTKQGCEDLDKQKKSGIYVFGNEEYFNSNNRSYNRKFCLVRDDGPWTVLQRRDNFSAPQNFNLTWFAYKEGFGNLAADFWFGNEFISKYSMENDLLLRIELEDFNGNTVWAEYSVFKVFSEADLYRLIVGIYKGNASDSFSSHNNTFFSTFDMKNDQAPECCPCAISYGGGWWFNSCFEANLNGIYHKEPHNNGYFGGIIWEQWLGDYSLKKSVMMAKSTRKTRSRGRTWPYLEDP